MVQNKKPPLHHSLAPPPAPSFTLTPTFFSDFTSSSHITSFQEAPQHKLNAASTALKMSQSKRKPSDNDINVKVKSQDGRELFFRINSSTSLQKLLISYCRRMNIDDHRTVNLLYNGARTKNLTPEQLGMEDGAEIDALQTSMGGGFRGHSDSFRNTNTW